MKYYTSTTEFNCGIDLHAHQMYVCVMDRQGKVAARQGSGVESPPLKPFQGKLKPTVSNPG